MPAVTQGKAQSRVTVYYEPPPDGIVNLTSAYWSGYYKTREPRAQQEYGAYLSSLDPSAKAKALADNDANVSAVLDSMRQEKADAFKYAESIDDNSLEWDKARLDSATKIGQTNAEVGGRLAVAEIEDARARDQMKEYKEGTEGAITGMRESGRARAQAVKDAIATGDETQVARAYELHYATHKMALQAALKGGASQGEIDTLNGEFSRDLRAVAGTSPTIDDMLVLSEKRLGAARINVNLPSTVEKKRVGAAQPNIQRTGGDGVSVSVAGSTMDGSRGAPGPAGSSGSVPPETGPGGASSIPWQEQLDALARRRAEIEQQFASPYENPYAPGNYTKGTGYGVFNEGPAFSPPKKARPSADEMKAGAAEAIRTSRTSPSVAADATSPADAAAARELAALDSAAKTVSARVAKDLDAPADTSFPGEEEFLARQRARMRAKEFTGLGKSDMSQPGIGEAYDGVREYSAAEEAEQTRLARARLGV